MIVNSVLVLFLAVVTFLSRKKKNRKLEEKHLMINGWIGPINDGSPKFCRWTSPNLHCPLPRFDSSLKSGLVVHWPPSSSHCCNLVFSSLFGYPSVTLKSGLWTMVGHDSAHEVTDLYHQTVDMEYRLRHRAYDAKFWVQNCILPFNWYPPNWQSRRKYNSLNLNVKKGVKY